MGRDETRRDERFVSVRRACLCVFWNGEPPRRELVDDGGGRLAHECLFSCSINTGPRGSIRALVIIVYIINEFFYVALLRLEINIHIVLATARARIGAHVFELHAAFSAVPETAPIDK